MLITDNLTNEEIYIKGCYKDVFSNWHSQTHKHPYLEILYIEKGSCDYQILKQNNTSVKVKLKKNDILILDGHFFHSMIVDHDARAYVTELELATREKHDFDFSPVYRLTPNLRYKLSASPYIKLFDNYNIGNLLANIQEIYKTNHRESPEFITDYFISLKLAELFLLLEKNILCEQSSNNQLYQSILNYINENFTSDISPQSIAQHFSISLSYLFKIFGSQSKFTINDYINYTRIQASIPLLLKRESDIIDIAIDIGFQSRQCFFYNFKKFQQCSPTEFLKKTQRKDYWDYNNDYQSTSLNPTQK